MFVSVTHIFLLSSHLNIQCHDVDTVRSISTVIITLSLQCLVSEFDLIPLILS